MVHLTPAATQSLPQANEMAFGIVVAEWNSDITGILLEGAMRTLREAGCQEHNIQVRYVSGWTSMAMATQFFAEYTDVDAVLVLGCHFPTESNPTLLQGVVQGVVQNLLQIQMQWNMPCIWGVVEAQERSAAFELSDRGIYAAAEAIQTVHLQIEMEAASPHENPDRRNLN